MATFLLDTSLIIDAINGKRDRGQFLKGLLEQGHLLACCPINVTEVYARKGVTLATTDVTVAAVALHHHLTLITDNLKHYPMTEVSLYPTP